MNPEYRIRPIEPHDNPGVNRLVNEVLKEFGCVGEGYACADAELLDMYATYQEPDSRYWVIEETATGRIAGGGGFARLKATAPEEAICELQKLYFFPELRGKGFGGRLLAMSIEEAAKAGYREMYLETIPPMEQAIRLYQKFGFGFIDHHRGDTGHHQRCKIYMLRPLEVSVSVSI